MTSIFDPHLPFLGRIEGRTPTRDEYLISAAWLRDENKRWATEKIRTPRHFGVVSGYSSMLELAAAFERTARRLDWQRAA